MARTLDPRYPNSFSKVQRALSSFVFNSGGLAIKAATSALVKSANAIHFIVDGAPATKAAADMAALSGTIADTKKGCVAFTVKADGTLTRRNGGYDVATLAACTLPEIPDGEVLIGFIIIENGTGSTFTGATTALDTASLTVTYFNTPYPYLPGIEYLPG